MACRPREAGETGGGAESVALHRSMGCVESRFAGHYDRRIRRIAAKRILDLAEELGADMILLGSRGLGSLGRLVLGSVSERVVHHATCPVLVALGSESAWPPRRVVIGDDGSEEAKKAGGLASRFGHLYGAEMVLVRAGREPERPPQASRV